MSFLSSFNISASALTAQRMRLDVASENIANIDTTRTEGGGTYRRKLVVLEEVKNNTFREALLSAANNHETTKGGVRVSEIIEDESEFKRVYNPDHPDADDEGYVAMPNVDLIKETVDSMSATRSYEANITAFNSLKTMAQKALEIK